MPSATQTLSLLMPLKAPDGQDWKAVVNGSAVACVWAARTFVASVGEVLRLNWWFPAGANPFQEASNASEQGLLRYVSEQHGFQLAPDARLHVLPMEGPERKALPCFKDHLEVQVCLTNRRFAEFLKNWALVPASASLATPAAPTTVSDLRFRENWQTRQVDMLVKDRVVFSASEYRAVAVHAQLAYGLSDAQLMELYRSYKEAYDAV